MKSERRKFGIVLLFAVIFTTLAFVSVGCASGIPPEEAWNKTFGGTSHDGAFSVQQTSDGGYILAGITKSYGTGNSDFWLVKTDSKGDKKWDRTFGGVNVCHTPSVQQTSDNGYILAGIKESYGAGFGDVWLIKVGGTDAAPPPAKATELAATSTPVQTPPPEQKNKTTQTIKLVGGIILLAATALLAGMIVKIS